ncbi:MAG: prefoldin subunit alpha [Halobacteriales archaeon]
MSRAGGDSRQQLQQLSEQLQELQEQIEALEAEVTELQAEKTEIDEAIEAASTLETGSIVQVPIGGDAYVRAEVQDIDEIIVGLGGGYATEQPEEKAVDLLEQKKESIDERIEDLNSEIAELESESEQLEQRAQQVQQQALQQQAQQQQGLGGSGPTDEQEDE